MNYCLGGINWQIWIIWQIFGARKLLFFCPIRSQNGGDRLELVWKDIVPRGSSPRSLLFFVLYFSARLDFASPPLSAPGSRRMGLTMLTTSFVSERRLWKACLTTVWMTVFKQIRAQRRASPGCFGFTGAKGCCGGSSHRFWEKFLNLPVVYGSETQGKRKECGISCIAITKYYFSCSRSAIANVF